MDSIGKRTEPRLRVRIPARLVALDFDLTVVLWDLSKSGARIECPGMPLRCCDVVLTWHEYEAFGRIMWSHSGETGIGFYESIPPEWLLATRELGESAPHYHHCERNPRYAQVSGNGRTWI